MGAFMTSLRRSRKIADRLQEYLRFGLEAGIFYST
jgi:hypothetical protein